MTTNHIGDASGGFGLGFGVMPDTEDVHEQLRASFSWSGFWTTLFRISPRGEWAIVTMSQVGATSQRISSLPSMNGSPPNRW
jgi:CubicO group peptidase (beta-lactamase class C family)